MKVRLRYQERDYWIAAGHWRGRDGHTVHFLTWVTDDLLRRQEDSPSPPSDLELALLVAEELGLSPDDVEATEE